jgi:tetratricopeptide (TPR) repeat protein
MYQEQASDPRQTRTWRIQGKHALQATRILLLALFILTIFGIVRISNLLNARLLVVSSVQRGELESLIINTDKLKKAINIAPYNNDHRILRISLIADVLEQPNPEPTPEQSQLYVEQLKLLDQDYVILSEALNSNELNGIQLWQIGSYAQRIGNLLFIPRELRAINRVSFLDYNLWHAKAAQFYEPALLKLPRNVVMQASIAQFYFLVGDRIEDTEENKPQKAGWYLRSKKLTDKSLAIDDTYGLALIGQAALLIRDEKQEQALGLIIPYVNSDVNLAYQAATISLELGKLEEAVNYYNIVLEQNPKHLQARFELTQALFALSRNKDAHAQLDELKALVPIDDFSTHEIIQELRESVE